MKPAKIILLIIEISIDGSQEHANGSASERIASAVFEALRPCDWVVSVHTGAEHVCDLVQLRCLESDRELCSGLGPLSFGYSLSWMAK